jgi:predicted  nucleic acid-binding Zn-ribbon protein
MSATSRVNQSSLPDTAAGELFNAGLAMTVIPGFLEEVASAPTDEAQPLAQRVMDTILGFSFGSLAMSAAPAFVTASGVALIGEKIFDTIDVLFTMAQKVEESGRSIKEQEEIINSFGPLLEISAKTLEQLTEVAKKEGVRWETSTLKLKDLEKNYPANADLLAIVSQRITFLQAVLPELISKHNITVQRQDTLTRRIKLIKQISDGEKEAQDLMSELTELTQSVDELVTRIERFEPKTAAGASIQGELIAGIHRDMKSVEAQQDLLSKTMSRTSHVNVNTVIC